MPPGPISFRTEGENMGHCILSKLVSGRVLSVCSSGRKDSWVGSESPVPVKKNSCLAPGCRMWCQWLPPLLGGHCVALWCPTVFSAWVKWWHPPLFRKSSMKPRPSGSQCQVSCIYLWWGWDSKLQFIKEPPPLGCASSSALEAPYTLCSLSQKTSLLPLKWARSMLWHLK